MKKLWVALSAVAGVCTVAVGLYFLVNFLHSLGKNCGSHGCESPFVEEDYYF